MNIYDEWIKWSEKTKLLQMSMNRSGINGIR